MSALGCGDTQGKAGEVTVGRRVSRALKPPPRGGAVKQTWWRMNPARSSRSLCCSAAIGADWTLAEHIWKRKRGDNRPNECAGDKQLQREDYKLIMV